MKKKNLNVRTKNLNIRILSHLKDNKIKKVFKRFKENLKFHKNNTTLTCGISGGIDSLALAFFLRCISINTNLKVLYFHVDHGLRPVSGFQSKLLVRKLKPLGINIKILKWRGKKPKSNIQKIARDNRYKLLFKEMNKNFCTQLCLAHNENDLIETFIMRLVRGSGLEGITSFNSKVVKLNSKTIFRPLLNIKKTDLAYISKKVFKFYVKDTSNYDQKYQRVRIRKIINELKREGLDISKINLTINNLASSNLSIINFINNNIKMNCNIDIKKNVAIFNKIFINQPDEIAFRSISSILSKINKKYYPTRGKKILKLISEMRGPNFRKTTLAGCIIEKMNNSYIINRENSKKN